MEQKKITSPEQLSRIFNRRARWFDTILCRAEFQPYKVEGTRNHFYVAEGFKKELKKVVVAKLLHYKKYREQ